MSTPRNRRQVEDLLSSAYDHLDPDEVRLLLEEYERVKKGDGEYVLVNADGGRALTIDRLDYA